MASVLVAKPNPTRSEAVARAWANLTTSGPTLNSTERLAVIASARAGWAQVASATDDNEQTGPVHGDVLEEAAYWLARDAGGLRGEIVDDFEARGLERFRYLEVVGVVARLANVDFYHRGLGLDLLPLPAPDSSSPTGEIDPAAEITDGWVPATGPLFAPASLDALPSEGAALRDLHEPMYMPMTRMGEPDFADSLTRAQIEFVAARTSFLNECFY